VLQKTVISFLLLVFYFGANVRAAKTQEFSELFKHSKILANSKHTLKIVKVEGVFVTMAWHCPNPGGIFSDGRAPYQFLRLFCPKKNSSSEESLEDKTEVQISFLDIVTPRISRGHLTPGPPASFRVPHQTRAQWLKEDLRLEHRNGITYFTVQIRRPNDPT
jgi:hypothetical protein